MPAGSAARGASSLRFVDDVAELAAVFESESSVVTLRRDPSAALVQEGQRAASEVGFRRLFMTSPSAAEQSLASKLAGLPHLAADLQLWVEVLSELTGAPNIGVRLARLEEAMCPRFHVDNVTLRLVVTYQGPGTVFVANEHVDRSRLGHAARGATDEDSGLLRDPGRVCAARTHDVVLLKGEAWPENAGRGAVHRSPAVAAEESRLVLTLDALS